MPENEAGAAQSPLKIFEEGLNIGKGSSWKSIGVCAIDGSYNAHQGVIRKLSQARRQHVAGRHGLGAQLGFLLAPDDAVAATRHPSHCMEAMDAIHFVSLYWNLLY